MLAPTWRARCRAGNLACMHAADVTRLIANGRVWTAVAEQGGRAERCEVVETAIAVQHARIAALGPLRELQQRFPQSELLDAGGRLITPGLIDCHTHIVH